MFTRFAPPDRVHLKLSFPFVLLVVTMSVFLFVRSAHAQTGTWSPNWAALDSNGNVTGSWSFTGTPTGSASNSYPASWQVTGASFYPFNPNVSTDPDLYGNGPFPLSTSFSLSASASNCVFDHYYGNWRIIPDTGSVTVNEQCDYVLKIAWDPIYQSPNGGLTDLLTLQKNGTVPTSPPVPSPPSYLNLLVTAREGGGASTSAGFNIGLPGNYPTGATASSQISDSIGDGASYSVGMSGGAYYRHLVKITGSSTVTKSIHVTGQAMAQDDDGTSVSYATRGTASVYLSYVGSIDPRQVNILSSLGQTYHKDTSATPPRQPNSATATGSLTDDTVVPTGLLPQPYTCTGVATSGWAPVGTTWSWSSSPSGGSASGDYPNIQQFSPIASNISDGVTDTVHFKMTDGSDGASESSSYYVRYHDPIPKANWSSPTVTKYHPDPVAGPPDPIHIGEWKPYTTITVSKGSGDITQTFQYTKSEQDSVSGTIGGNSTSTLTAEEISDAFSVNAGIMIGVTWTAGTQTSTAIDCKPGGTTYIYYGISSDDRTGVCDIYGKDGYDGPGTWQAHVVHQNPNGGSNDASIAWKTVFMPQ